MVKYLLLDWRAIKKANVVLNDTVLRSLEFCACSTILNKEHHTK